MLILSPHTRNSWSQEQGTQSGVPCGWQGPICRASQEPKARSGDEELGLALNKHPPLWDVSALRISRAATSKARPSHFEFCFQMEKLAPQRDVANTPRPSVGEQDMALFLPLLEAVLAEDQSSAVSFNSRPRQWWTKGWEG